MVTFDAAVIGSCFDGALDIEPGNGSSPERASLLPPPKARALLEFTSRQWRWVLISCSVVIAMLMVVYVERAGACIRTFVLVEQTASTGTAGGVSSIYTHQVVEPYQRKKGAVPFDRKTGEDYEYYYTVAPVRSDSYPPAPSALARQCVTRTSRASPSSRSRKGR
jgi:hypothetical protein